MYTMPTQRRNFLKSEKNIEIVVVVEIVVEIEFIDARSNPITKTITALLTTITSEFHSL